MTTKEHVLEQYLSVSIDPDTNGEYIRFCSMYNLNKYDDSSKTLFNLGNVENDIGLIIQKNQYQGKCQLELTPEEYVTYVTDYPELFSEDEMWSEENIDSLKNSFLQTLSTFSDEDLDKILEYI